MAKLSQRDRTEAGRQTTTKSKVVELSKAVNKHRDSGSNEDGRFVKSKLFAIEYSVQDSLLPWEDSFESSLLNVESFPPREQSLNIKSRT